MSCRALRASRVCAALRKRPVLSALLTGLLLSAAAPAQPLARKDVPAPLATWVPWVLDGAGDRLCPTVGDSTVCLWPGRLRLEVGPTQTRFVQEVVADRSLFAPLPGSATLWPQEVRLSGQAAAVVEQGGSPAVWLSPGSHRIEGTLLYRKVPDSLRVPLGTGLVDLTLLGRSVPLPKREEDGTLLLSSEATGESSTDELRLKVSRKVRDGIPLLVETRVVLEVAGKAREVRLAGALLPKAAPVSVRGDLPARLDGRELRVQVRPGSFQVWVTGRLSGSPAVLEPPPAVAPWPATEVWVFEADERLRQVELGGATAVDPSRTELAEEWRQLPAFLLEKGSKLTIAEVRRGEPEPPPDQVTLARTLWLDLDGRGFTAQDAFGGTLGRTTRLDLGAPGELGRASVDGQDQLVTIDPGSKRPGVELRSRSVSVAADVRLPRSNPLAAVGWDLDVKNLSITLHLPPGWRLLAASGADESSGTWVSGWTLFGFFFVLLVSVAVGRLFGPAWGGVALATLVLCHREAGAPGFVWIVLVVAAALSRVATSGRAGTAVKAAWLGAVAVLALVSVPFFVRQVRGGLYPQTAGDFALGRGLLEEESDTTAVGVGETAIPLPRAAAPAEAPAEPVQAAPEDVAGKRALQSWAPSAPSKSRTEPERKAQQVYEQDPYAIVQTGPGVPGWRFVQHRISWSGPVAKDQRVRLWLLPPFANLFLALLRVALVSLLAWPFLKDSPIGPRRGDAAPAEGTGPAAVAAGAILALLLGPLAAPPAAAQEQAAQSATDAGADPEEVAASRTGTGLPDDALLSELRERLLRPAPCAPACVTTSRVLLAVEGTELTVTAEVHAAAPSAWAVPGPARAWAPRSVSVDGQQASGLVRLDDGFLHLRLSAGVHEIVVSGPLPPQDSVTLQFPQKPRRARVSAPDWQVDGVREEGGIEGSVQLTRRLRAPGAASAGEGTYEPWVEVTRTFDVGVSWTAETLVRRVTPTGTPILLKVPLLKGMLATSGQEVKDGEILVSLGPDQVETGWASEIRVEAGEEVLLKAAEGRPWSEVWIVRCSPVWQCRAKGIPPVSRSEEGQVVEEYHPWPGETLALSFLRPAGLEGETLTIDGADLVVAPGRRLTDSTLAVTARASRATPLVLTLPGEDHPAEVQSLTVDGQPRPIRPDGGVLTLTVDPGRHQVALAFRQPTGAALLAKAPRIGLGRAATNVSTTLAVPEGRWLLLAGGPRWGPAILFWGVLLVLLLVAWGLGRVPGSPLTSRQWLLLTLGLSQIPIVAAGLVAAWFLLFAVRERRSFARPALRNLGQVFLVFFTLVFLGCLYAAVHEGLLLRPTMQVAGNGSTELSLRWYVDRVAKETPSAWLVSLPMWTYRIAMLAWSLWLAASLVRWLRWAFRAFTSGGAWTSLPKRRTSPPPVPPPPPPAGAPIPPPVPQPERSQAASRTT